MKKLITVIAVLLATATLGSLIPNANAGRHEFGSSHSFRASHSSSPQYSFRSSSHSYAVGVERDSRGHIKRSSAARHEYMRETGYPHGRPGYVIDHVVPLKRGGADSPSNMQWQTKAEAKAKDRTE
jgi:hypothetical protein